MAVEPTIQRASLKIQINQKSFRLKAIAYMASRQTGMHEMKGDADHPWHLRGHHSPALTWKRDRTPKEAIGVWRGFRIISALRGGGFQVQIRLYATLLMILY